MGWRVYWDASALAKRYVAEPGTPLVNALFRRVPSDRMLCLSLATLEVISILVRKKNAALLPPGVFQQALADFRQEVAYEPGFTKAPVDSGVVETAAPLVEQYSVNSTDAVVLRSAVVLASTLRQAALDLVLVSSDRRLVGAAQAEGLTTFNPETQTQADLDALLGP
jgi:predicted nucleic acid-binding protein